MELFNFMENSYVQIVTAGLLSTLLFIALIIYISKNPHKGANPLKAAFIFMFIAGMAVYCTCYYLNLKYAIDGTIKSSSLDWAKGEDSPWLHVAYIMMRSVMDVGLMFNGRNNSGVFYSLPESKNALYVIIFWLIHMIAFYTVASALLVRFGHKLLQWIRIKTTKAGAIDLVFGVNSNSLAVGRQIADSQKKMLIYVDNKISESFEAPIRNLEGFIYSNSSALKADLDFLHDIRLKPGKSVFRLYALSDDYDRNLQYAQRMLKSLSELNIRPEQTELVLLGTDEYKGMAFQAGDAGYGYGNVISCNEFEIAARMLVSTYPLCDAIKFDTSGRALEDMDVLIVGFGRMGQEVLRKLIANGQFAGSSFHAAVFDPDLDRRLGFIKAECPQMFEHYDIKFYSYDGRSSEIYEFIKENAAKLKYIVICLEDSETARDIAIRIVDRMYTLKYLQKVYTCDKSGVRCYSSSAKECVSHWIYDSTMLYSLKFDEYAMELNHRYMGGKNAQEDWKQCDYINRVSLRASVDYLVPLISKVSNNALILTPEQRENLAHSEYLRWCAFNCIFGNNISFADWSELADMPQNFHVETHENQDYKDYNYNKIDAVTELMAKS